MSSIVVEIPLQELLLATNNFAMENRIASGGYGPVYKGQSEKHGMIAVKRLDPKNGQGDVEFRREIALLSEYKHENIVNLLGFCDENDEKILVYKLESNGSLDKHLNNKDLSWIQRLRICLDAARGLKYLHDDVGLQQRILHRDVKSANILLDENWNAKISDFGLSRIGPANMQTTLLISNACGTFGYIDPEYLNTGCLTQKSDVYSFGVVLFEVLCGRPTRIMAYKDERQFLTVLIKKHYERRTLDKIIHFDIQNQIHATSLLTFSTIAYQCLKTGSERPTMNKVVQQLQKALHNQLKSSGTSPYVFNGLGDYGDDDVAALTKTQQGEWRSPNSWDDKKFEDSRKSVKTPTPPVRAKRGSYKRRENSFSSTKVTSVLVDDGHTWRKYGQQAILNSKHHRTYYRCTHKFDQGCQATKHVQKTNEEPPRYKITYYGNHTCKNFLISPQTILESPDSCDTSILLNFETNTLTENK